MTEYSDIDHLFKVVLLGMAYSIIKGDTSVGKSQILMRFTRGTFQENTSTTIGVEFSAKMLLLDNKRIKLQVWDTAGQEKFKSIAKAYYKGAVGAMIVYDITKRDTFDAMQKWLKEIREWADQPNIVILLIANKCDLEEHREVQKDEAIQFALNNKMGFLETSAKSGQNIEFAFKQLAEEIVRDIQVKEEDQFKTTTKVDNTHKLSVHETKQKPKKKNDGCC